MRGFRRTLGVMVVALLLLSGRAWAQTNADAKKCGTPNPGMSLDLVVNYCTRAIRSGQLSDENLAIVFNDRGVAYGEQGEFDRAIKDFDQAIRLNPNYAEAFLDRGNGYSGKGEYDRAIADYDRGIRLKPDLPMAYNDRGLAYAGKGEYDRAIVDYDRAIRMNPNLPRAFHNRGTAYADKGETERAIEDYSEAIRLNPKYENAFANRGLAYAGKGEYDRAIADYSRAIDLNPEDADTFFDRGLAYADKGEYDRAIADYDRAIRMNPDSASALQSRGETRFWQGRFAPAAADFSRAVQLTPDDLYGALWLYLAQTRAGQGGREDLAREAQHFDLSRWPGPVVSFYLGKTAAAAVLEAARDSDPKKQKDQECEASFYTGEQLLGQGQKAQAVAKLREAAAACPPDFIESEGAKAELKRLGD